jgi:hypothetical protein
MSAGDDAPDGEEWICLADRSAMRRHLEWMTEPVRDMHPDLRFELAWGKPERGPTSAKTFRLDQIGKAESFAAWINAKGCNVYVGVTLKRADTPARGRTGGKHAALATGLAIDIDRDFVKGGRGLGIIAKPQQMVITGQLPELRGQLWLKIIPTVDMDLWKEINLRSVCFSGGDRNALGTYRLMRLAGSISYPSSQKRERGYVVELTCAHFFDAPAYDLAVLLDRFPAVAREQLLSTTKRKKLGGHDVVATLRSNLHKRPPINWSNVALVQSMLDALPSKYASEFDLWLRVGFAVHDFDAGEIGLALWVRFSQHCSEKARLMNFAAQWACFNGEYQGRKISLGWLRAHAQAHDWRAPCRWIDQLQLRIETERWLIRKKTF